MPTRGVYQISTYYDARLEGTHSSTNYSTLSSSIRLTSERFIRFIVRLPVLPVPREEIGCFYILRDAIVVHDRPMTSGGIRAPRRNLKILQIFANRTQAPIAITAALDSTESPKDYFNHDRQKHQLEKAAHVR